MIKAKKMVTAVCLATLMTATSFSTITPFPQTTITAEAASVISVEAAGKKIAKAQDKAFNTKKDVTVTVKVKCASKKKAESTLKNIRTAIAKAELGDVYNEKANTVLPAIGRIIGDIEAGRPLTYASMKSETIFSGGVLTCKFTIHGGKNAFRTAYKENSYLKQNVADLKKRVEGMNEMDKAWEVSEWLGERMSYKYHKSGRPSAEALYKKNAEGNCDALGIEYLRYALLAGVKKPGKVVSREDNHAWNCVEINGTLYYLDMQDGYDSNSYDWLVENIDNTDEKALATLKRLFSDDKFVTTYGETGIIMSKGEYCLLQKKEFIEHFNGSLTAKPSQWKYQWEINALLSNN